MAQSIKSVKEQLRSVPNRGLHFGLLKYLSEDLKIRAALAKVKPAPILFNYLGQFDAVLDGNDLFGLAQEFRGEEHARNNARSHLLDINAVVSGGRLQLHWNFSIECFETDTIASLAALYLDELRQIIAHCVQPGVSGFTPSDFPLAKLSQQQLDNLIGSHAIGRPEKLEALYPLSPTQEGVLFHSLFDQSRTVYFEQFSVELLGADIDANMFADAWQQTINRHAILRTGFVWEDLPRALQYVQRDVQLTLIQLDWRESLPKPELSESENLTLLMQQDAAEGFDLKRPGLMRVHWVLLGENRYRMIWSFHHLLIDGWSLPVVLGDVFNIYNAKRQGLQPALTRAPKFEDFIAWLSKQDKAERDGYWKNYLSGFSAPTEISIRKPLSKIQQAQSHYEEVRLELSESITTALQSFARDHHVTLNTLVQGAWGIVLSRYSREKDVVFGVTVSGRPAELAEVENTVGMFINTLPMRVKTDTDESVVQWLQKMQSSQIETRRFESTPLVEIHRQTAVPGEQQLFDSILVFENYPVDEELRNRNPLVTIGDITTFEHTNYPLTFIVGPAKELTLRISYDTAQFEADALQRALGHVKTLLEEMLRKPGEKVENLAMLSAGERKQLIEEWNQTDADYPSDRATHELFEAQAEISPHATAILYREQKVDYATLNASANKLAHHLQSLGAKNKDNIAICLDRSVEMVTGLIAIMKTGGAYVALDPSYPVERLTHMVEDTVAPIIITHSRFADIINPVVNNVPHKVRVVWLDQAQLQIEANSAKNLAVKVGSDQLAHIVFTSGSTGKPKGVMIQHFGLTRLCFNTNYIRVTPNDRISHASNVSFDASTFELWGPLLNGATMVILDKETLLSPDELAAEVKNKQISILFLTTALVHYFAQHNMDVFRGPRVVMFGGEACDLKLIKRVFDEAVPEDLINLYGPSENSAYTSFYKICEIREDQVSIPIGKPVSNTK
ncbi:MAG TPA: condensation domain-containing protein, partial [Pseudomonadales bacterium]|nr:condensation domain-containing protein [Pseudomonadales bacterium]